MPQVRRTPYWDRPFQELLKVVDPEYPDTRAIHVKIVDGKFVSVLPPIRYRPSEISGVKHAARNPRNPVTEREAGRRESPVLLICRRMIDAAVHDAQEPTKQ